MKVYKLTYNSECRCHPCYQDFEPFFLKKETAEATMLEQQEKYGNDWEIEEVEVSED